MGAPIERILNRKTIDLVVAVVLGEEQVKAKHAEYREKGYTVLDPVSYEDVTLDLTALGEGTKFYEGASVIIAERVD